MSFTFSESAYLERKKRGREKEEERRKKKQRAIEEDTHQLLGFTCSCTLIHMHLYTCVHTDENITRTMELISDKQPYKRSTGYQLLGSFLIAMYILLKFLFHSPLLFSNLIFFSFLKKKTNYLLSPYTPIQVPLPISSI